MASHVSCVRKTARQGRPRFVRAFLYLSIYLSGSMCRQLGWFARYPSVPSAGPTTRYPDGGREWYAPAP